MDNRTGAAACLESAVNFLVTQIFKISFQCCCLPSCVYICTCKSLGVQNKGVHAVDTSHEVCVCVCVCVVHIPAWELMVSFY